MHPECSTTKYGMREWCIFINILEWLPSQQIGYEYNHGHTIVHLFSSVLIPKDVVVHAMHFQFQQFQVEMREVLLDKATEPQTFSKGDWSVTKK